MAVGKKVILRSIPHRRAVGSQQWVQDEEARYFCPECNNKVFRGVVTCNQCKTKLDLD
jgi:ribosomal protein L37AE/L43A